MPRQPDNERRATVTELKGDGRHFRASLPQENDRIQEFTLSTTNPPPMPNPGADVIIWYSIAPGHTDPDKIARFGSEPTYWANRIEPAATDQPSGTYEKAQAEAADRAQENGASQPMSYADAANIKENGIHKSVALQEAVKHLGEGASSAQVVDAAWKFYSEFLVAGPPHTHDAAPARAYEGDGGAVDPPRREEEPDRVYTG